MVDGGWLMVGGGWWMAENAGCMYIFAPIF
jgi:hypothetical protein